MRYETVLCNHFYKNMGKEALPLIDEIFSNASKKVIGEVEVNKGEEASSIIKKLISQLQEAQVFGKVEIETGNPIRLSLTDRCISLSKIKHPDLCKVTCMSLLGASLAGLGVKTNISAIKSRAAGNDICLLELKIL